MYEFDWPKFQHMYSVNKQENNFVRFRKRQTLKDSETTEEDSTKV